MTGNYYVRIRGRVQGPFDGDKLRLLARRGQFSRMHEVSPDGTLWESAADHPEFFVAGNVSSQVTQQGSSKSVADGPALSANDYQLAPIQTATTSSKPEEWFYLQGTQPIGPIDVAALQGMLAAGRLEPNTPVWTHRLSDWAPASQVFGMHSGVSAGTSAIVSETKNKERPLTQSGEIGISVCHPLTEQRSWVVFVAVMGYAYAALLFVGGLCVVVIGARTEMPPVVMEGILSMVFAGVVSAGSLILSKFASDIASFSQQRTEDRLCRTLGSLKAFWVYASIVLIVLLCISGLFAIVVFSTAAAIPSFN